MSGFTRANNTMVARWWMTVDRWTLGALCLLIGCGYIMVLAASPSVAERIHAERDMFIVKQLVFLAFALAVIVVVFRCCRRGRSGAWHWWDACWRCWPPR